MSSQPRHTYLSSIEFPDPSGFFAEGLVAVGGELDVGTLYHSYRRGIFPWPQEGLPLLWFCPEERGVLSFSEVRVPRSAKKLLRPDPHYQLTRNHAFRNVVEACRAQPRPGQSGTWILPEMVEAYVEMRKHGLAESFEVWHDGVLVGGLYGVKIDGIFSGESMFHHEEDASKRALLFAVQELANEGLQWMDTQMVTSVVKNFGGRLMRKKEFLALLKRTQDAFKRR